MTVKRRWSVKGTPVPFIDGRPRKVSAVVMRQVKPLCRECDRPLRQGSRLELCSSCRKSYLS